MGNSLLQGHPQLAKDPPRDGWVAPCPTDQTRCLERGGGKGTAAEGPTRGLDSLPALPSWKAIGPLGADGAPARLGSLEKASP